MNSGLTGKIPTGEVKIIIINQMVFLNLSAGQNFEMRAEFLKNSDGTLVGKVLDQIYQILKWFIFYRFRIKIIMFWTEYMIW